MDRNDEIVALFDLDGVIIDTETQYTVFWNKVGERYFPTQKDFGLIIKGQTMTQIYDKYFSGNDKAKQELGEALIAFQDEMTYNYIAGAYEFMTDLKRHGVRMGIVTSSDQQKMAHVYESHPELKEMADKIFTAEMFTRSKPAPDCFLLGAKYFGVAPEQCVVFEDSFHGLQAGTDAGMFVVGLATTNAASQIDGKCNKVIANFEGLDYNRLCDILKD